MQREAVSSSDIKSVGYDTNAQTLEIEFHSGGVYQYFSVPDDVYNSLMAADSHGKYFHAHIKSRFRYAKV